MITKILNPFKRAGLLVRRAGFAQKKEQAKSPGLFLPPNPRINPKTKKLRYFYEDPHNDTTSYERDPRFLKVMKVHDSFHAHAKKIRQMYLDSGYPPAQPSVVEPLRLRQPKDTLLNLKKNNEVACVIKARDQFEDDIYFVLPARRAHRMRTDKWGNTQQYTVRFGREQVRCTVMNIEMHYLQNWPVLIEFQRYIPGRPNVLKLSVSYVNLNQNVDYKLGCILDVYVEQVKVWCFNDTYPARIEVDMLKASEERPYKIGDLQRDMPEGMFLHRCYDRRKHEPMVKLVKSPAYEERLIQPEDEEEEQKQVDSDEEDRKSDSEEEKMLNVEQSLQMYEQEMKSNVNWEVTTTLSREALRTSPMQQLVEDQVQSDTLAPDEYYAFKDDLLRKLGVRGDYAEKRKYPDYVKPRKFLLAQKKQIDQEKERQAPPQTRPPSTGNRLNKKLHGKKHKKKLWLERQKRLTQQGHYKDRNLLEAKEISQQELDAIEKEKEEEKKLAEQGQRIREQLQNELNKIEGVQRQQEEMRKAREEAEKKGYDLREHGFKVLREKIKEETGQKEEKSIEEKEEKKGKKKGKGENTQDK